MAGARYLVLSTSEHRSDRKASLSQNLLWLKQPSLMKDVLGLQVPMDYTLKVWWFNPVENLTEERRVWSNINLHQVSEAGLIQAHDIEDFHRWVLNRGQSH